MAEATYVHCFDKGCHQPWYADFILANYLVARNDGGDQMRIVRCGDHPTCHSCQIRFATGELFRYERLEQAVVDLAGTDVHPYLEDALAIRKQEYGS